MSIVYISGPIAGYDGLNEVAFRAAAQTMAEQLCEAFFSGPSHQEHRERWRRVADVAIRWFGEQSTS